MSVIQLSEEEQVIRFGKKRSYERGDTPAGTNPVFYDNSSGYSAGTGMVIPRNDGTVDVPAVDAQNISLTTTEIAGVAGTGIVAGMLASKVIKLGTLASVSMGIAMSAVTAYVLFTNKGE